MKTMLASLALGILLVPSFASAQTVNEQYQATLIQLITLLTEKVELLQAQLIALEAKQDTVIHTTQTIMDTRPQNQSAPVLGAQKAMEVSVSGKTLTFTPASPIKKAKIYIYSPKEKLGNVSNYYSEGGVFTFEHPMGLIGGFEYTFTPLDPAGDTLQGSFTVE